jgi:AcrR family transcriptional regulator
VRDPSATRQSLLEAGRSEFARYGLAGARTNRVAAAAGVNKERIYAYFGSKQEMFDAVVDDALEDLLDLVPMPPADAKMPDAMADYVARVSAYHRKHPELMRLIQWEALERSTAVNPNGPRAARYRAKVDALSARLSVPSRDAAPLLIMVILLAVGPQAMSNITNIVMPGPHQESANALSEWAAKAAPAVIASATRPLAPQDPPPR